ncbi:MAG: glycosyltransferase [Bacteroidales bacterium]
MKVLFISSGNNMWGVSPIIKAQGDSLSKTGIEIEYFTINGKGIWGYLTSIPGLRKELKKNYDVVHAHYSLPGIVASLAGARPIIVSLMGSDVKSSGLLKRMIFLFNYFFWDKCIVKSDDMSKSINIKKTEIVPNGVDLEKFIPVSRESAINELGWNKNMDHVLFASFPSRAVKNYPLFEKSIDLMRDSFNIEIHTLSNLQHDQVYLYLNAANVVVLTSLWEGSPNVIKESMACSRPIVTTNVGDVSWVIGNTEGCYITTFDSEDIAKKLKMAIIFSKNNQRTTGRERIIELGLSDDLIAKRLMNIYETIKG